ncbi:MAG: AlwI family type II restriction endonuclease [bacterium]
MLYRLKVIKKLPNVVVKPNFISDDEGLPTSFASGGKPDIECLESKDTVLIEVTLLTGTQQHIRESFSIRRHFRRIYCKWYKVLFCIYFTKSFY